MSTIKEICKKIKQELNIMTSDEKPVPEPLLKTEDIVPEHTWIKSGVTCLASRPSVGKSALAIDFILDAALREKKKVVVFSLELSSRQFIYRMLRRISGIYGELHMEDKPKLESAISYLEKLNIIITDTPGISIQETNPEFQKQYRFCLTKYIYAFVRARVSVTMKNIRLPNPIGSLTLLSY